MTHTIGSVTPLIARHAELAVLEEVLDNARHETGRVCLIAGDTGIGKTRLARELSLRAQERGCAVLWGGCSELEPVLPFLPFNEAIDTYLATADAAQLRDQLGSAAAAVGAIVPQLSNGTTLPNDLSDAAVRLQLFEGVLAVLRSVAAQSGALMVIDDLHFADASTRALVDFIARRARGLRLLLLVTYRSDEVGPAHPLRTMLDAWRRTDLAATTELSALTRADAYRLVCARLGVDHLGSGLVDMLVQRSEGVPFAVEELLDAAISAGHLFQRDGVWRSSQPARLQLPDTLAVGIMQRLNRLEPEQQSVITAAAVLGIAFDPRVLSDLTDLPQKVVAAALRAATTSQLLERDTADGSRLRFRHILTYEAVRDSVPSWELTNLHSRAADVLAAATPPAPVIDCARHLLAAGRSADAAPLCAQAAEMTARAGAFAEAAMLYERALTNDVDPEVRGHLLCERGRMLLASGDPAAAIAPLQRGVDSLEPIVDASTAKLLIVLGSAHLAIGAQRAALDAFERARVVLEAGPPGTDLVLLYARLAMWHNSNLDPKTGLAFADRALALANEFKDDHGRAAALICRGAALCALGRRGEGIEVIERATAQALRLRLPEDFAASILICALQKGLAMRAGELSSLADLIRGHARVVNVGPGPEALASVVEALAGRFLGDVGQTEAAALALLEGPDTVQPGLSSFLGREFLAWARLQQGRLREAEALLEELAPREGWWHYICGPTRVELAMAKGKDAEASANAARVLLAQAPALAKDPFVVRTAVPALLAAGAEAEAELCVSAALGSDRHPLAVGAAADLMAYRGDTSGATASYREAAEGASAAGYRQIAAVYRERLQNVSGALRIAAPNGTKGNPNQPLSCRELELLTLLAGGSTDQQIAETLVISVRTVRSHLDRIRDKTGRRRRPGLTLLAIELGLLEKQTIRKASASGPRLCN